MASRLPYIPIVLPRIDPILATFQKALEVYHSHSPVLPEVDTNKIYYPSRHRFIEYMYDRDGVAIICHEAWPMRSSLARFVP